MSHPDGWVDLDSHTILDHPKESGLLGGGGKLWEGDQKKWGWGCPRYLVGFGLQVLSPHPLHWKES